MQSSIDDYLYTLDICLQNLPADAHPAHAQRIRELKEMVQEQNCMTCKWIDEIIMSICTHTGEVVDIDSLCDNWAERLNKEKEPSETAQ